MAFASLRYLIDLIEGKKQAVPQQPWTVAPSDLFADSVAAIQKTFPDIKEKIEKFIQVKLPNPLDPSARYGKHDRPMVHALAGLLHCHLRDDAILIYDLRGRTLVMVAVVTHADIEGKRLRSTANRMHGYNIAK